MRVRSCGVSGQEREWAKVVRNFAVIGLAQDPTGVQVDVGLRWLKDAWQFCCGDADIFVLQPIGGLPANAVRKADLDLAPSVAICIGSDATCSSGDCDGSAANQRRLASRTSSSIPAEHSGRIKLRAG